MSAFSPRYICFLMATDEPAAKLDGERRDRGRVLRRTLIVTKYQPDSVCLYDRVVFWEKEKRKNRAMELLSQVDRDGRSGLES